MCLQIKIPTTSGERLSAPAAVSISCGRPGRKRPGNIKNGYVFCGLDEELIKDGIDIIIKKEVSDDFKELNFIKIDGMNTTFDDIVNAYHSILIDAVAD